MSLPVCSGNLELPKRLYAQLRQQKRPIRVYHTVAPLHLNYYCEPHPGNDELAKALVELVMEQEPLDYEYFEAVGTFYSDGRYQLTTYRLTRGGRRAEVIDQQQGNIVEEEDEV
ncbi:MAG: hypothetical protein NZ482_03745 [Gloeomargarita sp. SKYG98]|nr:hypothetical protein [Gloeomargarita sp. SKYG98]